MDIKERIRKLRLEKGLMAHTLGEKTGLGQSTISKIETGQRRLDVDALEKIAKALDTSMANLVADQYPDPYTLQFQQAIAKMDNVKIQKIMTLLKVAFEEEFTLKKPDGRYEGVVETTSGKIIIYGTTIPDVMEGIKQYFEKYPSEANENSDVPDSIMFKPYISSF